MAARTCQGFPLFISRLHGRGEPDSPDLTWLRGALSTRFTPRIPRPAVLRGRVEF